MQTHFTLWGFALPKANNNFLKGGAKNVAKSLVFPWESN